MVRLVLRLNPTSKIGATIIGIGVLMSVYARMNNGPLRLNQAGVVLFVVGLIVYFAGRADLDKLSKWVFNTYMLIVALGLFERIFLYRADEPFFKALGVREWANMKGWGYGIPRSWYSSDLLPWIGERIRRTPGLLIGDAVNFGRLQTIYEKRVEIFSIPATY